LATMLKFDCYGKDLAGASDLAGLQKAKEINSIYGCFANILLLCCK